MKRVLFLCTGNSCRSQMAEGFLRTLAGDRFEVRSAGTHPVGLDPRAVRVMREVGVDIGGQASTSLDELAGERFDWVITVCDAAREACPVFPGAPRTLHWSLEDPARAEGTEEEVLEVFRRIRDRIRGEVEGFAGSTAEEA